MNQKRRSFENQLINIFWGLTCGYRLLEPYSTQFKSLGFKLVGLELKFYTTQNERATPDIILESVKLKEHIIGEWTQQKEISNRKAKQISKYINITIDSLRALISESTTENRDVILITTPEGEEAFKKFINEKELPVILFIYHYPLKYLLEKKLNSFSVEATEKFFKRPLKFKRIYYAFPDINLSNLSKSLLVDHVISTIIEFLASKEQNFEFNIEQFTQQMLSKPFYDLLSVEKRTEIAKVAKKIINELLKKNYCQELLKRIKPDPPTWQILKPKSERLTKLRLFKKRFEEFANKISEKPYNLFLFQS